jgi:hypothetical protein
MWAFIVGLSATSKDLFQAFFWIGRQVDLNDPLCALLFNVWLTRNGVTAKAIVDSGIKILVLSPFLTADILRYIIENAVDLSSIDLQQQ